MEELATLTSGEVNDYRELTDELLFLRSIKIILNTNHQIVEQFKITDDDIRKILKKYKDDMIKLNDWWEYIDDKYVFVHNEDKNMVISFTNNKLYAVDKQ